MPSERTSTVQNFVDETIVRGDWFEMELTSLGFTPGSHGPYSYGTGPTHHGWRNSARAIPSFSVEFAVQVVSPRRITERSWGD